MKSQKEEIFSKVGIVGIKIDVFAPTWTVNKQAMDALREPDFNIVETEEEILILNKKTHKTTYKYSELGSSEVNRVFLRINERLYKKKVMRNTQMVSIAMHPKDPEQALAYQKEMIEGLKNINYTFLWYRDIGMLFG
jgi:predicted deacetylase